MRGGSSQFAEILNHKSFLQQLSISASNSNSRSIIELISNQNSRSICRSRGQLKLTVPLPPLLPSSPHLTFFLSLFRMGFRHNNVLHNNHFRKDWQRRVKVWFDQPGSKTRRRNARSAKATALGLKPIQALRPAVRCPTIKYNTKIRSGKGFTPTELKAAGIPKLQARAIGIPVDHRRKNRSEEALKINVERVKAYKERLVVLPRRNKKNKGKVS